MPTITLSQKAKQDLQAIWAYIANDKPRAADQTLDTINERVQLLADNPKLGPLRTDIAPDLRYLVINNYLVLYRETAEGVFIVRVLHGARNLSAILRDDTAE
ncbi:type II toxin-antitoxin system RelE/ParE family toxin [Methylolobus aquaticus]